MVGYSLFSYSRLLKGRRESNKMKKFKANHDLSFLVFMILTVQFTIFHQTCVGQFHWGKNYRLEAQRLRDMFARSVAKAYADTSPVNEKNDIEVRTC